jgi:hypothetical protein
MQGKLAIMCRTMTQMLLELHKLFEAHILSSMTHLILA